MSGAGAARNSNLFTLRVWLAEYKAWREMLELLRHVSARQEAGKRLGGGPAVERGGHAPWFARRSRYCDAPELG